MANPEYSDQKLSDYSTIETTLPMRPWEMKKKKSEVLFFKCDESATAIKSAPHKKKKSSVVTLGIK